MRGVFARALGFLKKKTTKKKTTKKKTTKKKKSRVVNELRRLLYFYNVFALFLALDGAGARLHLREHERCRPITQRTLLCATNETAITHPNF